uniref:MORN repeat-containing protein 3 n=1 Tax=Salarias fasciatus TaxID=181472 RepID=A0A672IPZ4_SALFA
MPFLKFKKGPPASAVLDMKTQKCGLRHTVFSANGDEYTGEWLNNRKHGTGTQVWKKSGALYNGEWKFGKRDGCGTYSVLYPESKEYVRKYCGQWKNGKKHGYGTYYYKNTELYEGEWIEDQRSGWGRMYYENGDVYEGEWMKDKNHGEGIIRFTNGNWYEGSWRDGKKNGNGKFYFCDKGQLYAGLWVNGSAKCGTLTDFGRGEAPTPPKYPIPKVHLVDAQLVLQEAESKEKEEEDD